MISSIPITWQIVIPFEKFQHIPKNMPKIFSLFNKWRLETHWNNRSDQIKSLIAQIFCTPLYDIKYSDLIWIIYIQLYGIKYSYLIQIIYAQLYDIKYSYHLTDCNPLWEVPTHSKEHAKDFFSFQ